MLSLNERNLMGCASEECIRAAIWHCIRFLCRQCRWFYRVLQIVCRQPRLVVGFGHQHKLAEQLKSHADRDMVFRILSEPRHDQTFGVGFSGTAVSNEKKIRLIAADELRSPRQLFPSARARPYLASFSAEVPPRH